MGIERVGKLIVPALRRHLFHFNTGRSRPRVSTHICTNAAVLPVLGSFALGTIAYAEAAGCDRHNPILPPSAAKIPPLVLSRYAVADAVEQVIPSVVNIRRVVSRKNLARFLFEPESVEVSCGSGFFISENGHILTNSHVVSDLDDESIQDSYLQVTLSTGETYVAKLVAADKSSDIAIIKINTDHQTPKVKLGNSDHVRPGEFVVAVGSPLTLSNSCSFGIVSTIHRDLTWNTGDNSGGLTYLQLDMAINQGSSGGPCISLDGEVIGMCSMKIAGDAEGIAFAIPIKYAQKVVEDLQQHGYVRRPFVGLTLISVTPSMFEDIRKDTNYRPPRWLEAEMRNTNSAMSVGLMVHNVTKGGPGDQAGLKAGDVVVSVNEMKTTTTSEFLAALNFQVHKECKLNVRRGASGHEESITIRPDVLRKPDRIR
ncbi:Trypsin-like peptidase [Gracilaria domingensis]|nr:Trypsin-like peptidase [Gracilaria domingensis]